ncbi:hypothetical protein [Microbacterium sp. SLBN-146]|uniref:hypothetical protein n=1 Tax=Microbacterium sp. SLBN-146 TaxID=2768457 RepID=UPI0011501DFB|nr:hypothetical protein [Microbacterium sp. SLBN-146]TQJ32365.1 hypothetical protein FBY39_2871 [Microbacterium sp. SLBN-146]
MRTTSTRAQPVLAVLLALSLASCASPPAVSPTSPPSPATEGTASDAASPGGSLRPAGPDDRVTFLERFDIPSCGHERLGQGQEIPDTAVECLADPGTDGAELIVTAPTTEGDPIVTYYRADPDGSVEIWVDMTQDSYGGGWSHLRCPDAQAVLDLGGCDTDDADVEGDENGQ